MEEKFLMAKYPMKEGMMEDIQKTEWRTRHFVIRALFFLQHWVLCSSSF